jgi:hypothetical protein
MRGPLEDPLPLPDAFDPFLILEGTAPRSYILFGVRPSRSAKNRLPVPEVSKAPPSVLLRLELGKLKPPLRRKAP